MRKIPTKDKWRINVYSFEMRRKPTEAEQKMREILKELKISHIFQKRLLWYIPDFYLTKANKKIILEVDGEYHFTPRQREYDKRRDALLRSSGFKVIRFTNTEILESPEKVKIDLIKKYKIKPTPRRT